MSGVIGHMMYAILGGKAAEQRRLPVVPLLNRYYASYLAGAYLGCDVQTLPAAICVDTGAPVGYGSQLPAHSPLTGGAVRPYHLIVDDKQYTPRQIHQLFYGRTHLSFGWSAAQQDHALPWNQVPDYLAATIGDALRLFGPGHRQVAYILGWLTHVVGDNLIKSYQPGIDLELLDGTYTPQNRPIQDLVTFHGVGRQELGLSWEDLMADMASTPVEPVQFHYMRVAAPRGQLAEQFPQYWRPEDARLLQAVFQENRRYQKIRNGRLLQQLALRQLNGRWVCDEQLSQRTGGLQYEEMVSLAKKADFRHALWQMGEAVADLMEKVVQRQPLLQEMPRDNGPGWKQLSGRWKKQ